MYTNLMVVKVGVRELRGNLSSWLGRVQAGDEVIVTERGKPVARLIPVKQNKKIEQLIAEGRVTPARNPKKPIDLSKLPKWKGGKTLSDIVIEERRRARY
jgi:prevent-host-death family protein